MNQAGSLRINGGYEQHRKRAGSGNGKIENWQGTQQIRFFLRQFSDSSPHPVKRAGHQHNEKNVDQEGKRESFTERDGCLQLRRIQFDSLPVGACGPT
jgi:hypothetical protein